MPKTKSVSIVCGKCKETYNPNNPYLIPQLFNFKNADDPKSYYPVCKKCLCENIQDWFDYENILKLFETINIPFVEKIWHEGIALTNARLLQSNNNASAAFSSSIYEEKLDDATLVIYTLVDEYFKKAKLKINEQYFFNAGYDNSIEYMEQERQQAEKAISDAREAMVQKVQAEKEKSIMLFEEEKKATFLDEYGNFKVDMLSDNDYIYLSKKWGLKYDNYELVKLEEYWIKTYQSFEIVTSTHQDYLLKIAKISLEIDNSIEKNEWDKVKDLTTLMDKLMASANFTPKSKATVADRNFKSSIGELVAYIEQKGGFIPKFDYKVSKDLIDATIENLNDYTRNLVTNEVNMDSIVETAITKMEIDRTKEEDEEASDGDEEYEEEFTWDSDPDSYYSADDLKSFADSIKKKKNKED